MGALVAFTVGSAAVWASTGELHPNGCIADSGNNPDKCFPEADGLAGNRAVAVSPDGRSLYAVGSADNTIVRFKRNTTTGALTPKNCIADPADNPDGCTKTAKGLESPQALAISADGRSVYVAGYESNAIALFKRNTHTGALTPQGCIADKTDNPDSCGKTTRGIYNAESVAVSPDGRSVYAGGDVSALVRFQRNKTTGALKPKGCVVDPASTFANCGKTAKGLDYDVAVAVSPNGKSVYATGASDNAIVTFKRNKHTGALTKQGGCIADSATNPDGCADTTAGLNYANAIAVSPDGASVYVTSYNAGALVRFDRNTNTGALTPKGCFSGSGCTAMVPGLIGVTSVTVSKDGESVYTAGHGSNAIDRFARNKAGALHTKQCFADPDHNPDGCVQTFYGLDGANSVAASRDGKSVYVAGQNDNAIARFDVEP